MIHDNRESWLNGVATGMAPLFEALAAPLPDRVRVAIGFISAGRRSRAIGECWDNCSGSQWRAPGTAIKGAFRLTLRDTDRCGKRTRLETETTFGATDPQC